MLKNSATVAATLAAAVALTIAPAANSASTPVYRAATGVGADATSVNFSWRSTYTGAEVVRLAPVDNPEDVTEIASREADYGALAYRSKFAEATDLTPGETYTYRIGSDAGGWSEPETVRIDDGDGTWEMLAISDAQIGVGGKVSEQAATWRATAEAAANASPDASVFLSLGDQVEGWGDIFGEYKGFFSAPQLRQFRFGAIEGNHENYPSPLEARHFKEHWNLPNELGETSNYFFEQNNALIIGLNSNRKDDEGLDEQAQFVRETVAKHGDGKDWIIVANHFAFHSQGGRYRDEEITAMREKLSPVFSEVGVDLVLNGHDHMYNRSHLMDGTTPTVPEADAAPGDTLEKRGGEVLYLTLGTAGGGKYYDFTGNDGKKYPGMTLEKAREQGLNEDTIAYWNQDYTPDYSVISVSPEAINVRSLNAGDDSLVDDVTLTRAEDDKPAPEKPAPDKPAPEDSVSASSGSSAGGIVGILAAVGVLGALVGVLANQPQVRDALASFGVRF